MTTVKIKPTGEKVEKREAGYRMVDRYNELYGSHGREQRMLASIECGKVMP
jgi:hypothetical protein